MVLLITIPFECFDWEDVSRKIKRNTLPETSLTNNAAGYGVGKAPSNRVETNLTPDYDIVKPKRLSVISNTCTALKKTATMI